MACILTQFILSVLKIVCGEAPNRSRPEIVLAEGAIEETTELAELQRGLKSSIDILYRLSMLIRRDRPRGKLPLPDALPRQDPTLDIRHTKDKFPKVQSAPWLAERLGQAISERRDYILYRQEHQRDRERVREVYVQDPAASMVTAQLSEATTFVKGADAVDNLLFDQDEDTKLSSRSSTTSFDTTAEEGDGSNQRLVVPALDSMKFNGIRLQYGESFECPYCRTIQRASDYHDWRYGDYDRLQQVEHFEGLDELTLVRKHVFSDLKPYSCTFKDCTSGLFTSRNDWFDHELQHHRRQWYCNICHDQNLPTAKDLGLHLASAHQIVHAAELTPLLTAFQRPEEYFSNTSCPLCNSWTPSEQERNNKNQFRRHLGTHLQQLSLAALPRYIEGLENVDTAADPANSRPSSVDHSISSDVGSAASHTSEPRTREISVSEAATGFESDTAQDKATTTHASAKARDERSRVTAKELRSWVLVPNWDYPRGGPLAVGNILLDPLRPQRGIIENPDGSGYRIERTHQVDWRLTHENSKSISGGLWLKFLELASIDVSSPTSEASYSIDRLETERLVDPIHPIVENALKQPAVQASLRSSYLYMISGLMIADGFRLSAEAREAYMGEVGVEIGGWNLGASFNVGSGGRVILESSEVGNSTSELVFAYQLKKIEKFKGTTRVSNYNRGALF